jgi:hypothetical protein
MPGEGVRDIIGEGLNPKPETEKTIGEITEIRRKYLEALAISLGGNEKMVRMSVDALINNKYEFSLIDHTKESSEQSSPDNKTIRNLGAWLIAGDHHNGYLHYFVGVKALGLLKEDPDSGYFTNLVSHIGQITDGSSVDTFNSLVETE